MKIYFITTNKHKFAEVKAVLEDYPIELKHIDMEYEENHDLGMEGISKAAAKKLADELKKPVVVEDTGLFFEAYPGFPGPFPKFVINTLGYKGVFKLLEGETRKAYFLTVAAFCMTGKKPVTFDGIMKGEITNKVFNIEKDDMPYNRIFIPDRADRTISHMNMDERNKYLQRAKAFRKFGEYIKENERQI